MQDDPRIEPLLRVENLSKRYASPVLREINLEIMPGEVHALMGANGAGKSTLARILCGLTIPDGGRLFRSGKSFAPQNKRDAQTAGVIMVMQELNLLSTLSVAENIFLDRLPQRAGFICQQQLTRMAVEALQRVGLSDLLPSTIVGTLGMGVRQLLEIAAALARRCQVLILDEPTAALTQREVDLLFSNIRRLQADGVGILYISHRMDEIRSIASRVSVLRDGACVAQYPTGDVNPNQFIRDMSGGESTFVLPRVKQKKFRSTVLTVEKLCVGVRIREVSFSLMSGEILGLAGIVGSGRTLTLRALFGAVRATSGSVTVGEGASGLFTHPSQAVAAGMGMVPEDRRHDALLLSQSVRVNATLSTLPIHSKRGWLNVHSERHSTNRLCDRLKIACKTPEQTVDELSGGNQQKVSLGRWLERSCEVLLCDEPTRGVDAASKASIHNLLRNVAAEGTGVLVVSSELSELFSLCDRILVMSDGRMTGDFTADNWSEEVIHAAAFKGLSTAHRASVT